MKRFCIWVLVLLFVLSGCALQEDITSEDSKEEAIVSEEESIESDVSEAPDFEEVDRMREPDLTNLTHKNYGKMGDDDGPAYVVYGKKGYNKASFDLHLSKVEINNIRNSDGKHVNAYLFLGMDIYDEKGNWVNCLDTGFSYTGGNNGWRLFYNLYTTKSGESGWFMSQTRLDPTKDYRLTLDSSEKENRSKVSIKELETGKTIDVKIFESAFSLPDGSNTAYLQNYALDYPDNVKLISPEEKSEDDFVGITLYNSDEGLYMNNVNIRNVTLYSPEGEVAWGEEQTQNRSSWPDIGIWQGEEAKIDYPVVKVWFLSMDDNFTLDFDMNR